MDAALLIKVKNALKEAGLDEELAKYIKITKESEIEETIKNLKKKIELTPEQLLDAIKEAGLKDSFDKYLQSETDRRVTEAIKTHDAKLAKERLEKEKEETEKKRKEDEQKSLTEEQKKIADLTDEVKELKDIIKSISEGSSKEQLTTQIKTALKDAGLPESFSENIKVDDPEKIGDAVETLKNKIQEHEQSEIDKKLKDGEIPGVGDTVKTIKEDTAREFAEEENKNEMAGQPVLGKLTEAEK